MKYPVVALLLILYNAINCFAQPYDMKFMEVNNLYDGFSSPVTFNNAKLFAQPDTNSTFEVWGYKTPLTVLEGGITQGISWYKVKLYDTITGYLQEKDIIRYVFRSYQHESDYYIDYLIWIENRHTDNAALKIVKSYDNYTYPDTFTMKGFASFIEVKPVYFGIALKNVKKMFEVKSFMASCPGTSHSYFVADCSDSFRVVTSSFSTGESTYYQYITAYLPMRFDNGNILLVENGDMENIFNYQTGTLNTWPHPKNLKVPVADLVVLVHEDAETTEKDLAEYEAQDASEWNYKEPKLTITRHIVEYYRWDGKKLIKVQTIKK